MLAIRDLHVYYGGIHALNGVSLDVPDGQIISLIGANGAGKSTTLKAIMGLVAKTEGHIYWDDTDITSMKTKDIVGEGIILCPEGRKIFPDLTVEENLSAGAYLRKDKSEIAKDREWVYSLFPRLKERTWQLGATLSGGEQQMLAMGRALMSRPKLMMLDEPSMGLAPILVDQIFDIVKELNQSGVTILLVEQNAQMALSIANRGYVLETGRIVLSSDADELLHNDAVKKAYLGG